MKKKHSKTTMLAISCKQNADIQRKNILQTLRNALEKYLQMSVPSIEKEFSPWCSAAGGEFYILKKYQLSKEHVFHDIWTEICGAEPSKILGAEPC